MKKTQHLLTLLSALIIVSLLHSCRSADKKGQSFQFNLEQGKSYEYEIVWDADNSLGDQSSNTRISSTYIVDVKTVQGDMTDLQGAYKGFKMHVNTGGLEMDIDTDNPPVEPTQEALQKNPMIIMNPIFSAIKGKPFYLKVDRKGDVVGVRGFAQIVRDIIDSAGVPDSDRLAMEMSLTDQFSDMAAKDQFSQVFTIFPDTEVKQGDKWQKHSTRAAMGNTQLQISTNYTVKSINEKEITLISKSAIRGGKEDNVNGTESGTLLVSRSNGLLLQGDFVQEVNIKSPNGNMLIKGRGQIRGKAL